MKKSKNFLLVMLMLSACVACNGKKEEINKETYFLSVISNFPFSDYPKTDTLTIEQKGMLQRNHLAAYVPNGFQSVVDENDREALIFINENDSSVLLAKAFTLTYEIVSEKDNSRKYDNPDFGADGYNDLSGFKHYKALEKLITDEEIGPFLYGGSMYDILNANEAMHQDFLPKDKRFEFGVLKLLFRSNSYVVICMLHNGYSDDLDNKPRNLAVSFLNSPL